VSLPVLRIILGAISVERGGTALLIARGLGSARPTAVLTRPNGSSISLVSQPAVVANNDFTKPPLFAQRLVAADVWLYRLTVPPGLLGFVQISASLLGERVLAGFRPYSEGVRLDANRNPMAVSFALSSCYYAYSPTSSSFGPALSTAASSSQLGHQIDFKLFAGDNLYLDVAPDTDQFNGDEAIAEVVHRYINYFVDDPSLPRAFTTSPTFFTFDDHDLWNDYPHSSAWLSRSWDMHAADWTYASWDGIDTFQRFGNPLSNPPGRSYAFEAGGIPFFVADTRSNRSVAGQASSHFMPPTDLGNLCAWLRQKNRGPRVLVIGQPLWQQASVVGDHNLAAYSADFAALLVAIRDCDGDVLVLAGDPHFSRALELRTVGGKRVFEIISSPAVHIPSVGATASHLFFKTSMTVASNDSVGIDAAVEFAGPADAALRPVQYLYGSSCNATFALLTLTPRLDQSIGVRATFVDHARIGSHPFPSAERLNGVQPIVTNATVTFDLHTR
jgi:hypothetical protein